MAVNVVYSPIPSILVNNYGNNQPLPNSNFKVIAQKSDIEQET